MNRFTFTKGLAAFALSLFALSTGVAQERFITISGTVMDNQTKKRVEAANITIPNTNIGTITNTDGHFTIKVNDSLGATQLLVSHVGYANALMTIGKTSQNGLKIFLTPNPYSLAEVTIHGGDARDLVLDAVSKIADNYDNANSMLTGFYREIIQKRRHYVNVTEAIVGVSKSPYSKDINNDRTHIYKGRKLIDQKRGDTLAIKLLGGPVGTVYLDIVKNRNFMFDRREIDNYTFTYGSVVSIDNRNHYAIAFEPRLLADYALFCGTLYIDEATHTISRAEVSVANSDLQKAEREMLRKKPAGVRFDLNSMNYVVSYRQHNGRSYLYYVRSDMRFRCDWRKRLFHTNYAVVSEMVTTDRNDFNPASTNNKYAFKQNQALSDRVSDFYDADFWGSYNIIEPTESLENAIGRLKKQQQ